MVHVGALALALPAAAEPRRVVSLTVCTDQMVMLLADRDQIAGLSRLAADEAISPYADLAKGHRLHGARTEEVLALKPDLVVAGGFARKETVELLGRLGVPMFEMPYVTTAAEVPAALRSMGKALGREARAEALARAMEERLAGRQVIRAGAPSAAVWRPGGYVPGDRGLASDVLRLAGYRNIGGGLLRRPNGRVEIETLLRYPPDLLVQDSRSPDKPTQSQVMLAHPALESLAGIASIDLPLKFWLCASPAALEAADRLAAFRPRVTSLARARLSENAP